MIKKYGKIAWIILMLLGAIRLFIDKQSTLRIIAPWGNNYSSSDALFWKIIAVVIAVIISITGWLWVFRSLDKLLFDKTSKERKIFIYALPYAILLFANYFTYIANNGWTYTGDEANIYATAMNLWPFMFGITSEIYIICLFFLPIPNAPSIIKFLFEAFVIGYLIYKTEKYYRTKWAYILYLPFLFRPVLDNNVLIHRMQWYTFFYLLVGIKLFYDYKEKRCANYKWILVISACISILTIWRREGIYLFVIGAVLLYLVYYRNQIEGGIKKALTIFFLTECTAVLMLGAAEHGNLDDADTVTRTLVAHMIGEPIDRNLYKDEFEAINRVLSIDKIDSLNQDYGLATYDDTFFNWPDWENGKYYAIQDYNEKESNELKKVLIRLIEKEPIAFLNTRVKAWNRVAAKDNSYNLYFPLLIGVTILVYALIKKNYFLAVLFSGLLAHTAITILTMPASYFKYFYALWLIAYIFALLILLEANKGKFRE